MAKEILMGHEMRLRIKAGVDKAADAVRSTLGAVGMEAIIEVPGLDPIECDDGVTILRNLEFKDPYEQLGLQKLRKAAIRTSVEGGDGTATTTVLTQSLISEAFKEIANDSSRIREVRERLSKGLDEVLSELNKIKREVKKEDIEQIARISSLDDEVAKIIAEIIKEVGMDGVVTVEKGAKLGYSKEVVKGARFDRGLISPYFITDATSNSAILEDCHIVLVDRRISQNEQIGATPAQLKDRKGILGALGTGKSVLIIADDVDSVALGTLAFNASNKIANIACVRNPYQGKMARDFLFDMAALTGATVISEEKGVKLMDIDASYFGKAGKVVVTENNTTIIDGHSREALESRIASLKSEIEGSTSEYTKGILEDRLAALTGGIGVIRVGAYTDTEFNAKKYKFENAVNATQAALQEGILPGGGTALAVISSNLKEQMFANSVVEPLRQMAENAGMYKKRWFLFKSVQWLVDAVVKQKTKEITGFDFKTKNISSMIDCGIVDPFKVTRLALESATAITIALISKEVAIVTEKEDGKAGE